ncbi:VOC family protein [Cohnella thailandensis]|uniref:VOC family protein n=1 Tax=Cohnella thailandensis TaxID=557557 RepID=A0A841SRR4_9BACL|nr:VOC family protein [Cohnella thailandensis]MBB6633629.1 VOC family protein [Cohnella thailandensis]MBP1976414.1 lactoylglutathione lyase [Cohnella thailandensis]
MAVRKIEHVGIHSSNLEASIEFYTKVIGLDYLETLDHTNGVIKLAFLSFPGSRDTEIELIQGYDGDVHPEGLVHHVAFAVDDIEEEHERISKLNVAALDSEITRLPNGSRYFFFHGPDGESIEFFQSTRGGNAQ